MICIGEQLRMLKIFDGNDSLYITWVNVNPAGFVINTRRKPDPKYMVLHRAICHSITKYTEMAKPGGFTERSYMKVCANNITDLRSWVKRHGRSDESFSKECKLCKPM